MACTDSIVTLGICNDDVSTSGLTLMQAAGMSPKNLANIASEQYVQGIALANVKKQVAITLLRNDFISVLYANKIATALSEPIYDTSTFIPGVDMGLYAGARGVVIHGISSGKSKLRKRKITQISCYPLTSGTADIQIVDIIQGVTMITPFAATFVANRINTFAIDYECQNETVKVLVDNTAINFSSAKITCLKGCNNTMPNPCAWADGWNGLEAVKSEGYGINVFFKCHCDYEQLICDLATTYTGKLIWLKWQELVFDEQLKTNRFNSWVVYNREDLPGYISSIQNEYNRTFNDLVAGALFNMLKTYRDECLDCRGVRVLTNI